MDPSEPYYKAKRTLLFFAGLLLLAVFAGFRIRDGEQTVTVFPFQLENPEFLSTILFAVVLFSLYQFSLQWAAQKAEVQLNKFHKIDFTSTATVGGIALFSYAIVIGKDFVVFSLSEVTVIASVLSVLIAIATTAFSIFGSRALERVAKQAGRRIKGMQKSADQQIEETLVDREWILIFNPNKKQGGKKPITFLEDGGIGVGKNKNESSWRIRNGLLEILNEEDKIFSRFAFDADTQSFEHTNDEDTLSIRSQSIVPSDPVKWPRLAD